MSKGDSWKVQPLRQADPETGVMVERLSDDVGNTHHPYFTGPMITADGRYLLLSSDRSGSWQVCILDRSAGRIVQLTDGPDITHTTPCMDIERGIVYYLSGRCVRSVHIDGSDVREHYQCPEGFSPSILSISSCGRYLAFSYREQMPASTDTGKIYSSQAERFFQHPRSVVIMLDLEQQDAKALYGENTQYSHVSISPTDPNIVLFCHEGPWHLLQRMWIVRADTLEVWPLLETQRLLSKCGHEYFTDGGTVVTQYAERDNVRDELFRHANVLIEPDGSNERRFWYDGVQPMHVQTSHHDETLMIGDCGPRANRSDKAGAEWMSVIRLVGEKSEMTPLCRHSTSWTVQHSHPHAVFWPDDKWVSFNSDRGGRCNAYRAELPA
ncbi:MAG: PD40 domain-containing protein [Planctomycetes bacterium]|nr:PD40 domain-containing protein [Planctomycetota bacterium]